MSILHRSGPFLFFHCFHESECKVFCLWVVDIFLEKGGKLLYFGGKKKVGVA